MNNQLMPFNAFLVFLLAQVLTTTVCANPLSHSANPTTTVAVSADKRYRISAVTAFELQFQNAHTGEVLHTRAVSDLQGNKSRISAVYTLPVRESFVVALTDIAEIWQISYADKPPPGFAGWVHDYRVDSGENAIPEAFPVRVIHLNHPVLDLFVDPHGEFLVGVSAQGMLQVIDMDLARVVADQIKTSPQPYPGGAMHWDYRDGGLLAVPDREEGIVSLLNMDNWKVIKQINIPGSGKFMTDNADILEARVRIISGSKQGLIVSIDKHRLELLGSGLPAEIKSGRVN
ncbi:MAG: hypothetical protein L3J22_00080 [Xanthomonadales bacterium]|nr:hypothetical protein [Xanthomonadales bacterium]